MDIEQLVIEELGSTLKNLGFNFQSKSDSIDQWVFVGEFYQITITWDPRGELSFSISNTEGYNRVPLWMVFGQNDPDWAFAASIMLNSGTPERSIAALQRLKQLLQRHGEILTTRNDLLLPQLVARQRAMACAYTKDMLFSDALRNANKRWHSKRYQEFISILSDWENDLSPAMRAKLEFARKKAID